jgi:iron complex transport system substrate-binding protein
MLRSLICLFLFLTCAACFNNSKQHGEQVILETKFTAFEVKYAKGFSIYNNENKRYLLIHNPETEEAIDTVDLTTTESANYRYFNRVIAQSTTHFAFLNKINGLEKLVGLCGLQYLSDEQKYMLLKTSEICNAQGLDIEKIASLDPDLVFLYPFGDKDRSTITKLGIQTTFLTEYLESSPLARAEWLKFFAFITGQNPSSTGFEEIEAKYLSLIQEKRSSRDLEESLEFYKKTKNIGANFKLPRPNTVAFNLPYGDTWDMPSGNSISARLVQDAGLHYFLDSEKQAGNLSFKLEEAYNHLSRAHYWVIIAARPENYSLADLLSENRIYETFASVHFKTVIFCNTETTPYFSEGPIEPHILLQDLLNCLNRIDDRNKYFKLLM